MLTRTRYVAVARSPRTTPAMADDQREDGDEQGRPGRRIVVAVVLVAGVRVGRRGSAAAAPGPPPAPRR